MYFHVDNTKQDEPRGKRDTNPQNLQPQPKFDD